MFGQCFLLGELQGTWGCFPNEQEISWGKEKASSQDLLTSPWGKKTSCITSSRYLLQHPRGYAVPPGAGLANACLLCGVLNPRAALPRGSLNYSACAGCQMQPIAAPEGDGCFACWGRRLEAVGRGAEMLLCRCLFWGRLIQG